MQQRNINKDFRVLFGDIFIEPFLGPALRYLTEQCAARGGEIWLHLTGMICPLDRFIGYIVFGGMEICVFTQ